jgi:hypothetical protein
LYNVPLDNPALILFVDGSYGKNAEENYQAEYAVITQCELIEKETLLQSKSAQPAEFLLSPDLVMQLKTSQQIFI